MLPVKPLCACFLIKLSGPRWKERNRKKGNTHAYINQLRTFLQSEKMNEKFILKGDERGGYGLGGKEDRAFVSRYVRYFMI